NGFSLSEYLVPAEVLTAGRQIDSKAVNSCLVDGERAHRVSRKIFVGFRGRRWPKASNLESWSWRHRRACWPPWLSPQSRSLKASSLTQLFSGNPRAHSAGVTSRASCQPGTSRQSRNFRRLARTSVDTPRAS